jgi:nucleoside 2-deoxyribosyltransferase
MEKIYLAGPDVFAPNAEELGKTKKDICSKYDCDAHFPLDNEFEDSKNLDYAIVNANMKLIRECDIILANLNNFRGSKKHPACDSGTAWECGYAYGNRKIVIGYTSNESSVPPGMLNCLSYVVRGDIETALKAAEFVIPAQRNDRFLDSLNVASLDPEYDDIHDVDALTAFKLGIRSAYGVQTIVHITDKRSQIEKYGYRIDPNGYYVEDFKRPCNIMIAVNSTFY